MFVENNFIVRTKKSENKLITDNNFLGEVFYLYHFSPEILHSTFHT